MERTELVFDAPDTGLWTLDRVHFFRPWTAISAAVRPHALEGNQLSADRYGVLIDLPDMVPIHRFAYSRARALVPRPAGEAALARSAWTSAVGEQTVASRRLAAAEGVFTNQIWRAELQDWDEHRKPAAMMRTRELAAVEVAALDDDDLLAHIRSCVEHLEATLRLHHEFNGTWQIPLGDYLAHASAWTGRTPQQLAATLEGASPVSAGLLPELAALVSALRADGRARKQLGGENAAEILDHLLADETAVGAAAREYVYSAGYRAVAGFDPMDEFALEHPEGIVEQIRRTVDSDPVLPDGRAAIEDTRGSVPDQHRDAFDALLREARDTFRVKDERGLFANFAVTGLVRRGFLEVGRRAHRRSQLGDASHATEATGQELERLLAPRADATLADELASRFEFRSTYTSNDAPPSLGTPHEEPPPIEWLPAAAARIARASVHAASALGTFVAEPTHAATELIVAGAGVSRGSYTGPARLVLNPGDIKRVRAGDVLVAIATNPGYTAVMSLCGAIVTDAGGPLSHAAIVARELGVPAVVGTGSATTDILDGTLVTVDGATGEVSAAR